MNRVLASRGRFLNSFAEKPLLFLLKVDHLLLEFLARSWQNVRDSANAFPDGFESATFFWHGIWSDDAEQCDKILNDHEYVWLESMPNIAGMSNVEGHRLKLFASGNMVFLAYEERSGQEFESELIAIKEFNGEFSVSS